MHVCTFERQSEREIYSMEWLWLLNASILECLRTFVFSMHLVSYPLVSAWIMGWADPDHNKYHIWNYLLSFLPSFSFLCATWKDTFLCYTLSFRHIVSSTHITFNLHDYSLSLQSSIYPPPFANKVHNRTAAFHIHLYNLNSYWECIDNTLLNYFTICTFSHQEYRTEKNDFPFRWLTE